MHFPLSEPTSPRYIYINPKTNSVHVLMPVVSGTQIGLDNTCQALSSIKDFFNEKKGIYVELLNYKAALEFDILLINDPELLALKAHRLRQIKDHITAIELLFQSKVLDCLTSIMPSYPKTLLDKMFSPSSNLYSMHLKPCVIDPILRFVNPTFSASREDSCVMYACFSYAFRNVSPLLNAKQQFCQTVSLLLPSESFDFAKLQRVLSEQTLQQFNQTIDFYHNSAGLAMTKQYIDSLMGFDESTPGTVNEYIDALIHACAFHLFANKLESPFHTRKNGNELTIITQFFLAIVNIYCRAHSLTSDNFAKTLETHIDGCHLIADIIISCGDKQCIEDALLNFINRNLAGFALSRSLDPVDCAFIKKQFMENYLQIRESPHFDEFVVLDDTKSKPFVSHQGSICLNLAELLLDSLPGFNASYFSNNCAEFNSLEKGAITATNPSIHQTCTLDDNKLFEKIVTEEQFNLVLKKFSLEQQTGIRLRREKFKTQKFLIHVARGEKAQAECQLLEAKDKQALLQTAGCFSDYSHRVFNECTAYEYAYWAKDTRMRRMLELHMSDETKAMMLQRCEAIEAQGLTYTQEGQEKNTKHYDFGQLINALKLYDEIDEREFVKMYEAWVNICNIQNDIPAHLVYEYCRTDHPFYPVPNFREFDGPTKLPCYKNSQNEDTFWFQSENKVDVIGFFRSNQSSLTFRKVYAEKEAIGLDLIALIQFDAIRSEELSLSLEDLRSNVYQWDLNI